MTSKVSKKDIVSLVDDNGKTYLVTTSEETQKIRGVGVINPKDLIGQQYGSRFTVGTKSFWVLPCSLQDKLFGLKRKAQIILSKDIGQILVNCSLEPGQTVLEAGIGSGSLTIALASVVAPNGKVISYDNRQDFLDHATKNLQASGLTNMVETHLQDVTEGIHHTNLDAIILDIPNPWEAIDNAWNALRVGGYLCTYSPLISQVEKSVQAIQHHPFIHVITLETIQREMVVGEKGTRPSFHMLGHTGYLTFARKIAP